MWKAQDNRIGEFMLTRIEKFNGGELKLKRLFYPFMLTVLIFAIIIVIAHIIGVL